MIINDSVYGRQEIADPLAMEIINTPQMQRLKGVNQYGVWDFFNPAYFTSRFEHCVGVYLLLRKLGASREEQIAGLIHDIAHTAFSHVVDYVFDDAVAQTVHENFHEKVVFQSEIPKLLKKYEIDVQKIIDEKNHGILERDLPYLCADRVDYFLRDSLVVNVCSLKEVQFILNSLTVHDNEIVLNDQKAAELLAKKFIKMGNVIWANYIQSGSYHLMGKIIKDALKKEIITKEDFFMTDKELLHKLRQDKKISEEIEKISYDNIKEGSKDDYTYHAKTKARYVDPKILDNGTLRSLTELTPEIQEEIEHFRNSVSEGFFIRISGTDLLKPGKYQHYKGNYYELLHEGKHSETHEEMVVYKALYDSSDTRKSEISGATDDGFGKNVVWVRPKKMFTEKVIVDGKEVPRFRFVE